MRGMPWVLVAMGLTLLGVASATPGSEAASGAPIDPEVSSLRAEAWRAWFAGDEASLGRMLPPEFIGIGMADGPFAARATTLEESRAFHVGGGRLVSLEFPETQAQRYGDVVVFYGRYRAVIESGGTTRTASGRLTELFVKQGGRWLHTGWHLDVTGAQP